ncbi:S1 RNA-binding domain-containing protein [Candidatus Bipolaricaulota bacterium]|nr:S1 RNA-binding domain-containing protein [Candidatus Bipolaricaulota bacterium]
MTPKLRVGDLVLGKVIEIQVNGALLGFPGGEVGFLHSSEIVEDGLSLGEKGLAVGQELLVKVIGSDRLERPTLSLRRVTDQDREAIAYHREAIEFRSALIAHSPAAPLAEEREERIEWRLEAWLKATEAALGRLKRRREGRTSQRLALD